MTLSGFVAALAEQGPTRGPQHVFINRRIVKDRTIAHAIIDAYSVASIKERSPEVHLFLEMPPEAVDVNVHPTKAEVRFREQSLVHEVVRRALMDTLGHSAAPQLQLRPEHMSQTPFTAPLPNVLSGGAYPNRWIPQEVRLKPDTTGTRIGSSLYVGGVRLQTDHLTSVASAFRRPSLRRQCPALA
jgi:DNA mismatch repair protein MutL